jgi:hypothetical protein
MVMVQARRGQTSPGHRRPGKLLRPWISLPPAAPRLSDLKNVARCNLPLLFLQIYSIDLNIPSTFRRKNGCCSRIPSPVLGEPSSRCVLLFLYIYKSAAANLN